MNLKIFCFSRISYKHVLPVSTNIYESKIIFFYNVTIIVHPVNRMHKLSQYLCGKVTMGRTARGVEPPINSIPAASCCGTSILKIYFVNSQYLVI